MDEGFAFVPFAALPDPNRPDGAPMVADHEVINVVSATATLASRTTPRPRPDRFLAIITDPVFDSRDPRHDGGLSADTLPLDAELTIATRSLSLTRNGSRIPRLAFTR